MTSPAVPNKAITATLARLTESRQAIVRHMNHETVEEADTVEGFGEAGRSEIDASSGTWGLVKQVTSSWWRGHPASIALDFVKPVVQTYAEEKPIVLLGISAGLGAAIVVMRPWRLISLTGVLLAAAKSKDLSDIVRSLMGSGHGPKRYP